VTDKCNEISKRENIRQRHEYEKENKLLQGSTYNGKHSKPEE
jgi:hypothetical protein